MFKMKSIPIEAFQAFLVENSDYFTDYASRVPDFEEIRADFLEDVPPSHSLNQKSVRGVYNEGDLIAFIDCLDDFPEANERTIGYLVVTKKWRNRGIGRQIYQQIEAECVASGYESLHLTVLSTNEAAIYFWERQGYVITDEVETEYGLQYWMKKVIV
ncbi:MAG: GNAT family N-acetyltransferase [Aerococcaceae bacterium]|nr:GNAT family N-acetyltransferase [Aerococcaceae bacterium]